MTPGWLLIVSAGYCAGFPPGQGERLSAALSIPGTTTSIPNLAEPSVFAGRSNRGMGRPSSTNSLCALSLGAAGPGSLAAAAAIAPKPTLLPDKACRIL